MGMKIDAAGDIGVAPSAMEFERVKSWGSATTQMNAVDVPLDSTVYRAARLQIVAEDTQSTMIETAPGVPAEFNGVYDAPNGSRADLPYPASQPTMLMDWLYGTMLGTIDLLYSDEAARWVGSFYLVRGSTRSANAHLPALTGSSGGVHRESRGMIEVPGANPKLHVYSNRSQGWWRVTLYGVKR